MKLFRTIMTLVVISLLFQPKTSVSMPIQASDQIVTAHRGSSQVKPENTLQAIEQAYADGADIVEVDVRLTADGVVVLSHDDHLKRTAGIDQYVSETRYEDLKNVNVAAFKGAGYATIPTLEEVMHYIHGKMKINIELKSDVNHSDLPEKVVELIEQMGMQNECYITSFDLALLERAKERANNIQTGLIIGSKTKFTDDLFTNPAIDILSLHASKINKHVMQEAREHGVLVFAWTVNLQDDMRKMLQYNVDSIITDRPAVLSLMLNNELS